MSNMRANAASLVTQTIDGIQPAGFGEPGIPCFSDVNAALEFVRQITPLVVKLPRLIVVTFARVKGAVQLQGVDKKEPRAP